MQYVDCETPGLHLPSSSSVFLAISLGFTILGEIFAHVTVVLVQP